MARVGCCNCFLGWFALAGLCASGQALNDSPTIPNGDTWFDHPDILCAALETLGYHRSGARQFTIACIRPLCGPPTLLLQSMQCWQQRSHQLR
jgi:hypothetical protein